MKIKLDENLPLRLVAAVSAFHHEVDTVPSEGLSGSCDREVWGPAQQDGRFFITQDLDFANAEAFLPGTHAGLMLVRPRQPSANALLQRVVAAFRESSDADRNGCFVVLADRKLRVRRPT